MIKTQPRNLFWSYYLVLESDLESISRFIEFHEDNFKTYSIQLVHILLATGSEIDVLLKQLCARLDDKAAINNISEWRKVIRTRLSGITEQKVTSKKYGLNLTPWKNWSGTEEKCKNPYWWKAYNDVKHERDKYFSKANLESALNAVAALYLLNVHYHHLISQQETDFPIEMINTIQALESNTNLFMLDDWRLGIRAE